MAVRAPERGTFETRLREVRVYASSLVRLSRWPAGEPYWSVGVHRFDDPQNAFGVTYAAASVEVAFAETVIHASSRFKNHRYEVPEAELTGRSVVTFHRPRRQTLIFADLTGEALKQLGLNNDLSATDDCSGPQSWARAIHEAHPQCDGIRYVSRQRNDAYAYASSSAAAFASKAARCSVEHCWMRCAIGTESWLSRP